MRQASDASIAGQSAQPTASVKRRGPPRAGFACTNVADARLSVERQLCAASRLCALPRFNIFDREAVWVAAITHECTQVQVSGRRTARSSAKLLRMRLREWDVR
jgi:hypothetical protein